MTGARILPKLAAIALVGLLTSTCTAAYLSFRGTFDDSIDVVVQSGRSGLAMNPGALVTLHGVEVGRVRQVRQTADGAVVDIRLTSPRAVPANIGADIKSTTVFGAKYVALSYPANPSADQISEGTTIDADSVTVEVNTVFESLTALLDSVDPLELNSTLGALSNALRGNGARLGTALDDANRVLEHIIPSLPAMQHDIVAGADTAEIYAEAAPELLGTLDHLTTTARTVVDASDQLDLLLLTVIGMADDGTSLLNTNAEPLMSAIRLLRPTSALLAEYSPMFTCFLQGSDRARALAEPLSGGNGQSQRLNSTFLYGTDSYTYPANLPIVGATGGPRCGALPLVTEQDLPVPYLVADTGANPFARGNTSPALVTGTVLDFLFDAAGVVE
ncbi:MCE family protein [Rhodococcus erythropolis]|uniref:MCE family protein n=1 Tax=Rhodococcus erythropolis TaxID=1833 RepID=UPI001E50C50E|nr:MULTISPECIES: MCE family protein [Rhodococcus erythropolis group]MCD2107911.1 MCE family protein [Rhodococcus qingshengii]MCZ4527082.1 MCE family protein [Rhodococcus erythropolis]